MLKVFKIKGNSLFPLYKNSQLVLGLHVRFCKLKPKDIVVFKHQNHPLMIKQIQNIQEDKYFLIGTSIDSVDSKTFGLVDKKDISYKILFKIF